MNGREKFFRDRARSLARKGLWDRLSGRDYTEAFYTVINDRSSPVTTLARITKTLTYCAEYIP